MALTALLFAIILPLLSIIVAVWLSGRALRRAEEANDIAREALNIEKARLDADQDVFVQPVRYEPDGGQMVFRVLSSQPVEEIVFEFRSYAGEGGACHRYKVPEGEQRFSRVDFDSDTNLETPAAREFLARATWKRSASQAEETSGLYLASKTNYSFVRQDS